MMQRRSFLGAMLAACAAPAYVKAGVLMPVREIARLPVFGMDLGSADSMTGVYVQQGLDQILRGEIGRYDSFRFIESRGPQATRNPGDRLIERNFQAMPPASTPTLAMMTRMVARMKQQRIEPFIGIVHPNWADSLRAEGYTVERLDARP